jgi:phage terminase large subunit-like protein
MARSPVWTTACRDWETRILKGKSLVPFKPLFPAEAKSALSQFGDLQIVDAPGSPLIADACRPWVFDFAGAIFGAYDPEAGRRLINNFFLLISKKNWKSGLAASIMLTALIRNWRLSAEFLIVAPTIEVANNSYYPARDMVRMNPHLTAMMHVQDHVRTITHQGTGATLKIVAADNEAVSGKKAAGVLVDELWIFGKRSNAENMLREATGGLASRPEGFVIYLSTQSDEPPAGVFRNKLMYARKVRDGEVEDRKFLPVLYEFPKKLLEQKAYLNIDNLKLTNPNLGLSVDREYLEQEFGQAREGGPESLAGFLAKHANVEIGLSLRSDRWAGADFWEQAVQSGLTLDTIIESSDVLMLGLDGGGLDDLLGFAVVGRGPTGTWLHWGHAWAHPIVMERRKGEAERLRDFEEQGDLTVVSELGEDVDGVIDLINRCVASGRPVSLGVDPARFGAFHQRIKRETELSDDQIVGISQGWKLTDAITTAERKLAEGQLLHCGQAIMAWSVGNAKVEPRGNAITITKQAAGTAKIDPLMAMFNAVEMMSRAPESERSVYEELAKDAREPAVEMV